MADVVRREDRLRVGIVLWRLSVTGGVQNVVRNVLEALDPGRFYVKVLTVRPTALRTGSWTSHT